MTKRPTRYKTEVVDTEGNVAWEVLTHDAPVPALRVALHQQGFTVRRASQPKVSGPLPLTYSTLDPAESVRAAVEHAVRHETQVGNALLLLIHRMPDWVSRNEIRKVAGDSGDRRVRELRQRNWPIEIEQLRAGDAWHVRLNINNEPKPVREERGNGTLF